MYGLLTVWTLLLSKLGSSQQPANLQQDTKWDELIFTQMWGYSECIQFKDESHGQPFNCRNADKPSIWSIHGIWPTESGSFGPNFCTKVRFNERDISSIEDQLNIYWYEINAEKQAIHFWTHEWEKHGSCAIQSPRMDSELKYFQTGLSLHQQFDLYSALKAAGIHPVAAPQGYSSNQVTEALRSTLNATPHLQCYEVKKDGHLEYHLLAIEVCLNSDFDPVDCNHRTEFHLKNPGVYGNARPCPPDEHILYSDNFPKKSEL